MGETEEILSVFVDVKVMTALSDISSPLPLSTTSHELGGYTIVRPLGRGSMGEVFLAHKRATPHRRVALKVFTPSSSDSYVLQKRFRSEMEIISRCDHKNLAKIVECIDEPSLLGYAMEFYEGGDLREWMLRNDTFSLRAALRMLSEIAEGLAELHYHDILHRDIKPENILLTESGSVRIADFALARPLKCARTTEQGKMVGTLDYLSPEYLELGHESKQCDLYALGVLAFELFSRRAPFEMSGVYQGVLAKMEREAPLLSGINPSVPLEVSIFVSRLLRRAPEQRFLSAASVVDALRKIFDEVSVMGDVLISTHGLRDGGGEFSDSVADKERAFGDDEGFSIDILKRAATNEGKVVTFPNVSLTGGGTITTERFHGRFGVGIAPVTSAFGNREFAAVRVKNSGRLGRILLVFVLASAVVTAAVVLPTSFFTV